MSRDPLDTLARLRRSVRDDATRALAACLAAEEQAGAVLRGAEAAIIREQEAAAVLTADDAAVEAFAAWLPQGRQAVMQARTAHAHAVAATVQARAVLGVARTSAEALDRLLADRAAAAAAVAAKRAQAAIDEAAGRRRRE